MQITTKFKPGDELWIMWQNKSAAVVILEVMTLTNERNITRIRYDFNEPDNSAGYVWEHEAYATKEELLATL